MKTILQNYGNRVHFHTCAKTPGHGFTVNVWLTKGEPSYDAGFYAGSEEWVKPARFMSEHYREGVGYRVRVKPKRRLTKWEMR